MVDICSICYGLRLRLDWCECRGGDERWFCVIRHQIVRYDGGFRGRFGSGCWILRGICGEIGALRLGSFGAGYDQCGDERDQ